MKRRRKPNLLVLLTFFVGSGALLSSVSQASEPPRSVWSLDLAAKISNWKPKIRVDSDGEGVNLSRPFGTHGPAVRLSTSIPERAQLSLRAGGDNRVGSAGVDAPGPYLFLHKRW